MPTLRFSMPSGVTSVPSKRTLPPASGASRPAMMRKVVVLPQPEGPRNTTVSPAPIVRSSGSSARVPSANVLAQRSSVIEMGLAASGMAVTPLPPGTSSARGRDSACMASSSGTIIRKNTSV